MGDIHRIGKITQHQSLYIWPIYTPCCTIYSRKIFIIHFGAYKGAAHCSHLQLRVEQREERDRKSRNNGKLIAISQLFAVLMEACASDNNTGEKKIKGIK